MHMVPTCEKSLTKWLMSEGGRDEHLKRKEEFEGTDELSCKVCTAGLKELDKFQKYSQ